MLDRTALAATAALALALPAAAAADAKYTSTTQDLSAPVFKTEASLVPQDVNHQPDYYARVGGAARLLTSGTGADQHQYLWRTSGDGSVAYFRTLDALVAQDTDATTDLYVRSPSGISVIAPEATAPIEVVGIEAKGSTAYLRTAASLAASDTDEKFDLYQYDLASTGMALMTPGTSDDLGFETIHNGAVVFSTVEALLPTDSDAVRDVYSGDSSGVELHTAGDGPHPAYFEAIDAETGNVLYSTTEPLLGTDTDGGKADLYESDGDLLVELRTPSSNGNVGADDVVFLAADWSDLHRVLFKTNEKLVAGDTDTAMDFYAHDEGKLTLLTPGTGIDLVFEDVSGDAETLLFSTRDPVMPATDTDDRMDMYRSGDFGRIHVSKTNGPFDEFEGALSLNGVLTAYQTAEPISGSDTDTVTDVYRLDKGGVHLMSRRDPAATEGGTDHHAETRDFLATSELIFETDERLLPEDRNDSTDVYAVGFSGTVLVSHDDSAPDTLAGAPAQVDPGAPFAVTLAATEAGTLECRVDGGEWAGCATGWTPGGLAAGEHTLEARATDRNGNVDATPATAIVTAAAPGTVTEKPPVVETPEPPVPPVADTVAPAVSKAKVRVRRRVPTLTYALSEKATVEIVVQRRSGRRWKTLRRKVLAGAPGANRTALPLLPKLPRRGTFRVSLIATDAAGNASARLVLRPKGR